MGTRLTDNIVAKLPLPAKGIRRVWDAPDPKGKGLFVRGFGLRLSAGGTRSFVVRYRRKSDGVGRLFTVGPFPDWTVDAAREEALDIKRRITKGADPLEERQTSRDAPTVAMLGDRFLVEHAAKKRPATQRGYTDTVEKIIKPKLGTKRVAAVTDHHIEKLHREVSERGPYQGNRVLAVLSKMFSLAVKWRMRSDNPVKGIERNGEAKRKRYLDVEGGELERLVRSLAEHEDQHVTNAFRLLLLTGARKGEVLGATWNQFNLARGLWTKPASGTKQKAEHQVPLSKATLELLQAMRKDDPDGEYLFPSRSGTASGHLTEVKKAWAAITKRAGIKNLRIHDLRHSFASALVSAGHSLPVIGALLGHSNVATTSRYSHLYDSVQREAANAVGSTMAGLVAKPPTKRKPLKVVSGGKR